MIFLVINFQLITYMHNFQFKFNFLVAQSAKDLISRKSNVSFRVIFVIIGFYDINSMSFVAVSAHLFNFSLMNLSVILCVSRSMPMKGSIVASV